MGSYRGSYCGVDPLFSRRAFARTAIATAATVTAPAALAILAFLHRWTRLARLLIRPRFAGLTRRLIGTRLTRLTLFPRLPRRAALLLVAALLVHIPPGTLAITALALALGAVAGRAFFTLSVRTRLARGTVRARPALVAAARLLAVTAALTALARTAVTAAFATIAATRTLATLLLTARLSGLRRSLLRGRRCSC